ncbi:LOW QUALITY PROTEIN: hypothetical protein CH63R_08418 [Colletotrichum higginsianum IMI 349063]|uniref:Uncharacterized protein n=1 Tax=Colletotrichum higginsianum (strain IMI 349063) TaxID=759273 RepID=A0A1B7YC07_COLHI|nr:LOW QUALITY PROTEIN: hypothetical protein CH63R_08418 [Colletotrichum higginsianum IMI 349063]OBR09653.1 LOW QUALITY PROTEIN: hypothetical protein CH63R_08418 [Colletotrichum higginsianum IMI 349063]
MKNKWGLDPLAYLLVDSGVAWYLTIHNPVTTPQTMDFLSRSLLPNSTTQRSIASRMTYGQ